MNELMTQSAAPMALNVDTMTALARFADAMASSTVTVPDHLRGKPGDCLAVAMQAVQWGMNPFAVAQKTHVVSGRLGYEAQLVNAVVQASGAIRGSFKYEFAGDGSALACRVGAVLSGEAEVTWGEWLKVADVTTKNSPLWKVNPKQQLGYLQVKNWSRLYCPGAILGVYTPDELEQAAPVQAAPRHMGEIKPVAQEISGLSPELIAECEAAAAQGVAAYSDLWRGLGRDERRALAGEHERLKATAVAADAAKVGPWVDKIDAAASREDALAILEAGTLAVGDADRAVLADAFERAWTEGA